MSEALGFEEIFEGISQRVQNHYYGKDGDVDMWEYQLNEAEIQEANRILAENDIEPADKIYIGREVDPGNQANQDATEINNVNLQAGRFIYYYHFTRHGDASEIVAEREVIVDGDSSDFLAMLRSCLQGTDPYGGLGEYARDMKQIGAQELVAISALIQLLKMR